MGRLDDFNKKKKELEEIITSFGKGTLKEEFKFWFEEFPELKGFGWTQYTPYFNDGEPCEFSVYEGGFFFSEEDLNKVLDGEEHLYDFDPYSLSLDDVMKNKCSEITQKLSSMGDILESVFGDGVQVIVTPTKIEVTEYDHD
jgi:hypothetical protein